MSPGKGETCTVPFGMQPATPRYLLNAAHQNLLCLILVINIRFYFSPFSCLSVIPPCYLALFSQLCFASLASLLGRSAAVHSPGLL